MVRRVLFLFFVHDHRTTLGAHHDLVFGSLKIFHFNQTLIATSGKQCRFIHQIGQISTRKTWRAAGNRFSHDVGRDRNFAHVHV